MPPPLAAATPATPAIPAIPADRSGAGARLLLVTGAPASGKTQLAGLLTARYGALACSKDELKETLFDTLGTADAAWSHRLSDASFALLFTLLPRLLQAERLVVVDGNFRAAEHETALRELLTARRAPLAQVLCTATAAVRRVRLAARANDPRRHPGHRDAFTTAAPLAAQFLALPGLRLRFDSEADAPQALAALYAALDGWVRSASGPPG